MFLELVKKLRDVDDSLSLSLNLSEDNVYTISIDGMEYGGYLYSFSSTDIKECYDKVAYFIECLDDSDKFVGLLEDILNEPFEVTND